MAGRHLPRGHHPHRRGRLQASVDGLALEREHTEDALVDLAQRRAAGEPLEALDAKCELAHGERALRSKRSGGIPDTTSRGIVILASPAPGRTYRSPVERQCRRYEAGTAITPVVSLQATTPSAVEPTWTKAGMCAGIAAREPAASHGYSDAWPVYVV
jgi:hypothetical protein